jgi:hypothetical protein
MILLLNILKKTLRQGGVGLTNTVFAGAYFGNGNDGARFIPAGGPTNASVLENTINGVFNIYGADLTTAPKSVFWVSNGGSTTQGAIRALGTYTGTSAISQIDLIRSGAQTITGNIKLYGIS